MKVVSILIPCYNNEKELPVLFRELEKVEDRLDFNFQYILIDDHSTDNTLKVLQELKQRNKTQMEIVALTRNHGSYLALLHGLKVSRGNAIVIMAADMQDPPSLIPEMIENWQSGSSFVLAIKRPINHSLYSKLFSYIYYYLLRHFGLKNVPKYGVDFGLFDKKLIGNIFAENTRLFNIFYYLISNFPNYKKLFYEKRNPLESKSQWNFYKKSKYFFETLAVYTKLKSYLFWTGLFFLIVFIFIPNTSCYKLLTFALAISLIFVAVLFEIIRWKVGLQINRIIRNDVI